MKKLREWVNGLEIKKKLIVYAYMTIAPVLILVCGIYLFYNYRRVFDEELKNELSTVNTLSDSVRVLQESIKEFSTYICINNEIHGLLTTDNPEELNRNSRLWLEEAPMQVLQDMMSLDGYIRTIAIYPENGVRPYLRCMDESAYVSDMEKIRKSEVYRQTLESENGMLWKSVPKGSGESYQMNRYDKVMLYREIYDLKTGTTLGFLAIGADHAKFNALCESAIQGEWESVLILDPAGGEIARAGALDAEVESYLKDEEYVNLYYRERQNHFRYGNYEVVCRQDGRNASIVCKIYPAYRLRVADIISMPLLLLLGTLLGMMPLFLIISNLVTKPLRNLSVAIERFSKGDFTQQVEVTTRDEVGEAAQCFNRMVGAIRTLIDENYVMTLREKESELAALQAQINPHFLYNTLDSLYWKAMEKDNEELAETILALSQLFRLVLNRGSGEVTLEQEMELVSCYLQIQKVRFSRRLHYEIIVAESVKKARIPKLIVQPFVENAIVHGFENVSTPCVLTVSASELEKRVHIEICDTGIGMNIAQINALWETEPDQYKKQRIGRYAIKNIRERLQLKYGKDYHLEIKSTVGKGTTVILEIPLKGENEENGS